MDRRPVPADPSTPVRSSPVRGSLAGVFPLDLLAGMLAVVGLLLIFSALSRRGRRPDLLERLQPHQPTVGDEAQAWLDHRREDL